MKKSGTLAELICGIALVGVIAEAVCVIAFKDDLYNTVGLLSGIAVACFWAIHLKRSIEDSLELDPDGARKHARKGYVFRIIITALLLGAVIYFHLGNPILIIVGIISLKISVYINPAIHKVFSRLKAKRRGR